MVLLPSDAPLAGQEAWTNPNAKGLRIRANAWDLITGDGSYNWAYPDEAVKLGADNTELVGFSASSLATPPAWLKALGAKTVLLASESTGKPGVEIVLPNDPVYQRVIHAFLIELGKRYDGKFAYFVVTGLGQPASESYMARSSENKAKLAATGFGAAEWTAAANTLTDFHLEAFKNSVIEIPASQVFPDKEGSTILSAYIDTTMAKAANTGVMNSGLNAMTPLDPGKDSPAAKIKQYAGTHPCGFQMIGNSDDPRMQGDLATAIQNGESILGNHGFIEVTHSDAKNSAFAGILKDANTKLGVTEQ